MKAFSHFPSFSCFWSESRSLKLLQVASCKFNKKRLSVIGSPFAEDNRLFVPEQGSVPRSWSNDVADHASEVRGMRLEVRRSRSLRSSDLLPLTSSSSQGRVHDLGRRTKDDSSQRSAELLAYSGLFGERVHDLERSTANHISKRTSRQHLSLCSCQEPATNNEEPLLGALRDDSLSSSGYSDETGW
jgi:hypothetical protein